MREKNVRVPVSSHPQRGAASDRDDLRPNARSLLKGREQGGEQARIANARGGHEQQIAFFWPPVGTRKRHQRAEQQG